MQLIRSKLSCSKSNRILLPLGIGKHSEYFQCHHALYAETHHEYCHLTCYGRTAA